MRVSTDKQDCESQKLAIERYLSMQENIHAVEWFEDTGTGTNDKRRALQRLTSRMKEFDTIIIYKLDRLFRSTQHMMNLVSQFQEHRVNLVSVKDNLDLSTPAGRLVFQMLSSIAEFEAAVIRERVCDGLKAAKARGVKLGAKARVIDLARVKELRLQGHSLTAISRELDIPWSTLKDHLTRSG